MASLLYGYDIYQGGVFSFGYFGTDASSDVTIQNSSFANCQSTNNFGGVIAGYRSHMELIGNTFSENYAGNSGGAIDYINDCTVIATCNTFLSNKAGNDNGCIKRLATIGNDLSRLGDTTTTTSTNTNYDKKAFFYYLLYS